MLSSVGMHLWSRSEASVEEEGSRIRESSQRAAASSAFPCVSHSPWSFQPAHQQPQSQGASVQGEGRCLEGWVGHGTVNGAPPPTCLTAASGPAAEAFIYLLFPSCACVCGCVSVCVCLIFFLFLQLCFAASTLCRVWNRTHTSLLMPPVAPRCWGSERAKYSERERERDREGCMMGKERWRLKRVLLSTSCSIYQYQVRRESLAEVKLMSHF